MASQNIHNIPIGIHCQQLWNVIIIAVIVLYFWIYRDLTWYFCNHIVLLKLCCIQNSVPSKPNGDLSIVCNVEFGLNKSHFSRRHTFQDLLDTFKLTRHAKCLSLGIKQLSTWIESNSSLLMCAKTYIA